METLLLLPFFRDWGKYIMLLFNVTVTSVPPKLMAEGGRFWQGWTEITVITDDFPHYWA